MLKKSDIWAIYENTLTPSLIIDGERPSMKILKTNPTFCQLAGKPEAFFEGAKVREAFRPFISTNNMELLDDLMDSLVLVKTKKKTHDMKVQRVYIPTQKTGSLRERKWRIINTPILGEGKKLKSIILSITDVTEQIHLQEKDKAIYFNLTYQQQIYKGIFDNHPNMLFKLDNDGYITSANGNFQFVTERKEEELTKLLLSDITHPDDELLVKGMLQKCHQREIVNFHVSLRSKRNRKINCEATLMPLAVQDKVVGVYGILVDKTQEKLQQQHTLQKSIYTETIDKVTRVLLESNHGQETIQEAFRLTGNAILVDVISFYKVNKEGKRYSSRLLYKWKKSERMRETFESFTPEDFQYCLATLEKNRIYKSKVSDLKKSALRDKMALRGSKAIIFYPVFCNEEFWGIIMFEDMQEERNWQLEDVTFLKTIVVNLSVSLERVLNKKALTDSKQQFESIIQNIPGSAYRCLPDSDWTMLYINENIQDYSGYQAMEFMSGERTFASIIHPEDLPYTFEATGTDEAYHHLEYRIICADGSIKWVEDRSIKVLDDDGNCKYHDGVVWDVTHIKEVTKEVEFAHRKFESLIQEGGELYAISTDDAYFTFVSSTYMPILGYAPEDLTGKSALGFVHPDDLPELLQEFAKIEQLKQVKMSPYRFRNKAGEFRWIESHATDLRHDPAVNGVLVNSRDITERMEELDRLRLMDQIIKNSKDAVYVIEASGKSFFEGEIIFANEAALTISGMTKEEVLGNNIVSFRSSLKNPEECDIHAAAFDPSGYNKIEIEKVSKSGEPYWVTMETFPMRNHQGKISHYIIIQRDITAKKHEENRKNLLHKVRNIFSQSIGINEGIREVLKAINEFIQISLSEAWIVSKDNSQICKVASIENDSKGVEFSKRTKQIDRFAKGDGLPGLTWMTGKLENMEDHTTNPNCLRLEEAYVTGLNQGYSVPMLSQGVVFGVLTFLSEKGPQSNLHYFEETLLELGNKLGMELEKKRMMEELNNFFDLSGDMMCILHQDKLYKVNQAFACILGYEISEIKGKSIFDFIHPDDIDLSQDSLRERLKGTNVSIFENRYLTKHKGYRWISWSTASDLDELVLYAVGKDVTENKLWQNNLLTLNKRLNQAQAIGKVGYWHYDFASKEMEWTDEVYKIYGKEIGYYEPSFQKSLESVHPEDKHILLVKNEHEPAKDYYDYHFRLVMDDGTTKYVNQKINIIKDGLGNITAWEGVIQDVTEIKRWQMALSVSNEKYKLAMQATNEMLWDWQIDEDEVTRGSTYLTLFGKRFKRSKPQDWLDIIHPEDRDKVKESIESALKDRFQLQWKAEYRIQKQDGQMAYMVDRGSILRDTDGVAERIIGAALDVSKSRKMISKIKRQNQQLREIAWTQSHVVRAPLARLKGLINLLESESPKDAFETFKEMLPHIKSSTDELDEVIGKVVRSTEDLDQKNL
ncbi:PAS domain S-box protein [Litoribacter alkaliphilus]|uniref:histidine kinase n=1 Tax=Litoribacter ruber TaxID=702568 RepID=A0AAP2CGV3_9BACT|nr:PAS domain S-box protein [Litoribacter alkaliphilus]MBS9523877.1 PAS domain S-box protein [Litoribacter alkaliphilus]